MPAKSRLLVTVKDHVTSVENEMRCECMKFMVYTV